MITLQSTREIVPSGSNQGVLAGEILDHGFICRLHRVIKSAFTITWSLDLQQGIKEKMYIKFIREIKTQALVRTKILLVIEGNNRRGTFCVSGLLSSAFLSLR